MHDLRALAFVLGSFALIAPPALAEPAVLEAEPERSRMILLQSGAIDISAPERGIPGDLKISASVSAGRGKAAVGEGFAAFAGEDLVLVKFPGPVTAVQMRELERQTERVYTYLPHDTFLVRLARTQQHSAKAAELGASWMGAYHPAYKIAPAIDALDAGLVEKAGENGIVMLRIYPDADLEAVKKRLEVLLPGRLVGADYGERFSRARLVVPYGELAATKGALARISEVFFLALEPRRVLLNDTTVFVAQSGTNGGQATPIYDQGIFGEGQIVGVLDTGIDADMCYFRDGTLGLPPQNPCNGGTLVDMNQRKVIAVDFLWGNECSGGIGINEWDTNDHGTHVAGTALGDNLANPIFHDPGDGLAPGAKLVMQDCGFRVDNCADCPGIGACPVVDLNPVFQQAFDQGARIHTNSWGDDENNPVQGLYSAGSEDADEFMRNHPDFLLLFAAGNSGPGTTTVGSPSTGKNVVAVGATLRGTSAGSMASFSSCGPTEDGRIKPDVTMPGSGIVSANADNNVTTNNCNTTSLSGTSMASPAAAGAAALIRQYFTDGWHPSGAPVPADGFTPTAALLKATLINSAVDMTGAASIPSNCQGWGRVLLDDALHFTTDQRSLFLEDDRTGFAQGSSGQERSFPITVSSSAESFKVTLTWTDFPSTPAASTHLVNDLDLRVTGPGGTFLGNVFSGGQSQTGGSADRLNTVEQVLLASPTPGNYTVTVRSFTVPQGPQPFALVVTGDLASSCTVDADCDDGLFCNGTETCGAGGVCEGGTPPCSGAESCLEDGDVCVVCLHDADFESGADGWAPGSDTCTTGTFVAGTPDPTDFQPGGGNPGGAFFTQPNPGGVGTDDVDGGTCEALSPLVNASAESEVVVALDFFHGQRDAGDDGGDGFTIEVLNNGAVVDTLVSIGDVTSGASWNSASTTVTNPGNIQVRVRASDGAAGGDIVEGGVDNVLVCPTAPSVCTSDADCSNGLFCDGVETCNLATGACEAGTPVDCADGVACTVDSCNEASDSCDHVPDDAACSNGLFCDGVEVCNVSLGCQDGPDPCGAGETCNETSDVCEGSGDCSHTADFESGSGGWVQGADTCTTGSFVLGTPDATTFQVGGGNPGQAFFTAPNAGGLGTDDVDGGTCEALSPQVDCAGEAAAEVSLDFFHGQRDAGDDAADSFTIEVLSNGLVVDTLVAIGDVVSNPAWTSVSTVVNNPGSIQVRVRASDGGAGGDIVEGGIDNVRVTAATQQTCSLEEGFESGMAGWVNSPSSTCTTGAYVVGNPTNPGGGQQIVGSHTGTGSLFTAVNTGAGTDDVDGGTCVVESPSFAVASASTLSVFFWHGQRDNADDPNGGAPNGDFFLLEFSTDGGANWSPMASGGDVASTAAWTEATAPIPAGADVRVRMQCADGSAAGDLVECGIDDVTICN